MEGGGVRERESERARERERERESGQRELTRTERVQARESAVAEAEAEAARVAAEQERQRKAEQQQLYAQHLRAQMAEDIEKRNAVFVHVFLSPPFFGLVGFFLAFFRATQRKSGAAQLLKSHSPAAGSSRASCLEKHLA